MVESNVSVLYTALSERVTHSSTKSLFLSIARDSYKHSMILKDACELLSQRNAKKCINDKLDDVFNVSYVIYKELIAKEEAEQHLAPEELLAIAEKLLLLERTLCEKYSVAQSKTLRVLGKETLVQQHVSLDVFGALFARLIDDSEQHQKILGNVKSILEQKPEIASVSLEASVLPAVTCGVKIPHK